MTTLFFVFQRICSFAISKLQKCIEDVVIKITCVLYIIHREEMLTKSNDAVVSLNSGTIKD
jgi:hypothetical protein